MSSTPHVKLDMLTTACHCSTQSTAHTCLLIQISHDGHALHAVRMLEEERPPSSYGLHVSHVRILLAVAACWSYQPQST